LGLFWLVTGFLTLTVARPGAMDVLAGAGLTGTAGTAVFWLTSLFDIAVGLAMLAKWRVRSTAALMIAGTLGYVAGISWLAPDLWIDPLGPVIKVFPAMALALLVAATEDER